MTNALFFCPYHTIITIKTRDKIEDVVDSLL